MHLVGIGFTPEYWEELVHSIRKQSPDETLVGTLLSTEAVEPEHCLLYTSPSPRDVP